MSRLRVARPFVNWMTTSELGRLFFNGGSMVATTGITSAVGFLYWLFAARLFAPAVVGLASATVSATLLLGTVGALGLGTLLVGELPKRGAEGGSLVTAAVLAAGGAGSLLGICFAVGAPSVSTGFAPVGATPVGAGVFAFGSGLTAAVLVFDTAMLGLLRGELQLARNASFAVSKLVGLVVMGLLIQQSWLTTPATWLTIYATWPIGNVVSFFVLAVITPRALWARLAGWPQWRLLTRLRWAAIAHHSLNLALQAPGLVLPLLVTTILSTNTNAAFYVAWNVAAMALVIPSALAFALFASGARAGGRLWHQVRVSLGVGSACGVVTIALMEVGADQFLRIFGNHYADSATTSLRVLAFAVLPLIVRSHYVAMERVRARAGRAAAVVAVGATFEIATATVGAHLGGLPGLSVGWVAALCVEAVVVGRVVWRSAMPAAAVTPLLHATSRSRTPAS